MRESEKSEKSEKRQKKEKSDQKISESKRESLVFTSSDEWSSTRVECTQLFFFFTHTIISARRYYKTL